MLQSPSVLNCLEGGGLKVKDVEEETEGFTLLLIGRYDYSLGELHNEYSLSLPFFSPIIFPDHKFL